jgi:hypothetical protein
MSDAERGLEIADSLNGRVNITFLERGVGQSAGDVRLRVRVLSIGFAGEYDGVWIEAQNTTEFIDQLAALERDRRGSATLTSMSPGDFSLQVRIVDSAGHAAASGFLGRWFRNQRGPVEARVGFDLNLEPDRLPYLLREAQRVLVGGPG